MDVIDVGKIHPPPGIDFPRIPPNGFKITIFVFLAIAIVGTFLRIGLRVFNMRQFGFDDGFLLLSLASLAGMCALNAQLGDILYIQIFASLGVISFPTHAPGLLRDHQILQAAAFLGWVSIFSSKISLLIFFRRNVTKVRPLEKLWCAVMGVVILFACITIPLGFMVCTDFSANFIVTCPASLIDRRERTYTIISAVFDVLSDFLILTIPIALLRMVQIDIRKKIALGSMLCLSVFSMAIATTRAAGSLVGHDVTDGVWLFFWQTMEASVAIIMVAMTGFRSLFRSEQYAQRKPKPSYGGTLPLRHVRHDNSPKISETLDGNRKQSQTEVCTLDSDTYSARQNSYSVL